MRPLRWSIPAFLVVLAVSSAHGSAGYTNLADFQSDAACANFRFVTDFDLLSMGSFASDCGMFSTSAFGFDSWNAQEILTPVVSSFTTLSPPNCLGPMEGYQFLGGNGDTVTFAFSRPIKAFGAHLIGNPSPTGDPPIPFWRMHVNAGSGYDAYSATSPYGGLGDGNDLYFLGVVSADQPFDTVTLDSGNDPAACYSFNVDDISVAAEVPETSVGSAKAMPAGEILVGRAVVTRRHEADLRFYMETADRSSGLAVQGALPWRGETLSVYGTTSLTEDGEVVLNAMHVMRHPDEPTPRPLAMNTVSVGGETQRGEQVGCTGCLGPNNVGLDVRIWGTVTEVAPDGTWMTVDDGAGRDSGMGSAGVKVWPSWPLSGYYPGSQVIVTGSSSISAAGGMHYPMIRVAEPDDISDMWLF